MFNQVLNLYFTTTMLNIMLKSVFSIGCWLWMLVIKHNWEYFSEVMTKIYWKVIRTAPFPPSPYPALRFTTILPTHVPPPPPEPAVNELSPSLPFDPPFPPHPPPPGRVVSVAIPPAPPNVLGAPLPPWMSWIMKFLYVIYLCFFMI